MKIGKNMYLILSEELRKFDIYTPVVDGKIQFGVAFYGGLAACEQTREDLDELIYRLEWTKSIWNFLDELGEWEYIDTDEPEISYWEKSEIGKKFNRWLSFGYFGTLGYYLTEYGIQ